MHKLLTRVLMVYSDNFDSLVKFIDSAQFTIIEKEIQAICNTIEFIELICLERLLLLTPLDLCLLKTHFQKYNSYKNMAFVPIDGTDSKFQLKADIIDKNGYNVPVFEVRVSKDLILYDQNKDLIAQEKETISVDGVNGPFLILGSMSDVSTNGNWPTTFDVETK